MQRYQCGPMECVSLLFFNLFLSLLSLDRIELHFVAANLAIFHALTIGSMEDLENKKHSNLMFRLPSIEYFKITPTIIMLVIKIIIY